MKYLKIIFILLIPVSVFSQEGSYLYEPNSREADSLKRVYESRASDTIKMEVSRLLGFYYHEKNTDSALYFQMQQLKLARKLGFRLWEADALELCGFITKHMGEYPVSLQYFQDSKRITENPNSELNAWRPEVLSLSGTPSSARLTIQAFTHLDMGGLYRNAGSYEKEFANYNAAIKIGNQLNDHVLLSLGYGSKGDAFMSLDQLDSALYYSHLEILHTEKSGYYKYYGGALNNIGFIYFKKGAYEKALSYYHQSLQASQNIGNTRNIGEVCVDIAELYAHIGRPDSSIYFVRKSLLIASTTKLPRLKLANYKVLSRVFANTGMMDSAFYYQSASIAASDSMFSEEKIVLMQNLDFSEQLRQKELKEQKDEFQNKIKTRALLSGLVLILIIAIALFRNSRIRKKAYQLLSKQRNDLQSTLADLKNTQEQLIHSEKMASLGELIAGIAHEIQNPLNFVNNFSDVSIDLIEELYEEIETENTKEIKAISGDLKQNLEKIHHHGIRASSIVKGMLEHSRTGSNEKQPTDINAMADEYIRLAYHGMRAKDNMFQADFKEELDENLPKLNVFGQDIARVVLNLINNAFQACAERSRSEVEEGDSGYKPLVVISTHLLNNHVEIRVKDNGKGIPQEIKDKIFQPFFTTKPTGEGTGLGLSLSYDIITKLHGGALRVETTDGEGSSFIINLPIEKK